MALIEEEDRRVFYRAIHRRVLVAVVVNDLALRYRAYVYPVPGEDHAAEAGLWRTEGCRLDKREAEGLWGGLIEELDGLKYSWG